MAILAALLTLGSRFAGKILTTALGWASVLLFGRVPADRQILVLSIAFGSVIWMVLLGGVLFPDLGTFLLLLVPSQEYVPESYIRLAMLIGAALVPAVVGALTLALVGPTERTAGRLAGGVLRGYPLTVLLAVLLVFLAGLAIVRKATSLRRGWSDTHVPIVVKKGAYDRVAEDLDEALSGAGMDVEPRLAPAAMSKPAQWLSKLAGPGSRAFVPDRMVQLHGPRLDVLIYPTDLLISGKAIDVSRARAAMASRLATSAAYLTATAEAQALEDRLADLARPRLADEPARAYDDAASTEFRSIDEALSTLELPYEEWEVLYRQRLQVERDMRAASMASPAIDEAAGALASIGELVRAGAGAVAEGVADEETVEALDRAGGSEWRWAARLGSVVAGAVQGALAGARERGARQTGEPATFTSEDRRDPN